ncbi:MAG TPA: hemerythrin domain-containing protein [Acidimicrobiales bacterium]|jgi:hemerythrin superfamily protein
MDAITLLKNDHQTVEGLFKRFEKAGDGAHKMKQKLVERMIRELSMHAAVEEMAFYPFVKGINDEVTDNVLESLEEHHVVKWQLSELDGLSSEAERFDAKVTVLIENVRHHVKEEEKDMFPRVRKALSRDQLAELGDLIVRAKKVSPTRPHPKAPDEPPGNAVAGLVAGLIDRVRDSAASVTAKAATTGRQTLASRNGRRTRKAAPRKSTARKSTARKSTARRSTARKSTARKTTAR